MLCCTRLFGFLLIIVTLLIHIASCSKRKIEELDDESSKKIRYSYDLSPLQVEFSTLSKETDLMKKADGLLKLAAKVDCFGRDIDPVYTLQNPFVHSYTMAILKPVHQFHVKVNSAGISAALGCAEEMDRSFSDQYEEILKEEVLETKVKGLLLLAGDIEKTLLPSKALILQTILEVKLLYWKEIIDNELKTYDTEGDVARKLMLEAEKPVSLKDQIKNN